jgi:hypothetical protein
VLVQRLPVKTIMSFVKVAEEEGDEPMELPVEDDGSLLLTTLTGQFPGRFYCKPFLLFLFRCAETIHFEKSQ